MENTEDLLATISNLEAEISGLEMERDTMIDIIELADELRKDYSKANKKAYDEARENLGDF